MSFIAKGDFKTREEWLKKQKRAALKKQQEKFKKETKGTPTPTPNQQNKNKLNQIVTLDTEHSLPSAQTNKSQIEPTRSSFKNQADVLLYNSMAVRLKEQQELSQSQRKQLSELSRTIQEVRTDNAILKGINSQVPSYSEKEAIEQLNQQLKKRSEEMQSYLNAHGAFYEGSVIAGEFKIDKIKKDIKLARTNYRTPTVFEFTAIAQRIQELNENLVKELGTKRIVNAQGIAKFTEGQILELTFYRNAVRFEGIGVYNYSSKEGLKILEDLTEGYYPHVLRKAFPDGVFFRLSNELEKEWSECQDVPVGSDWFFGQGHSLEDN